MVHHPASLEGQREGFPSCQGYFVAGASQLCPPTPKKWQISLFFSLLHNTPFVATLNGLKIIIFSEISQRKINLYDITYVGNLKIKL